MAIRIQLRRDISGNWETNNPLLYPGEMGIEIDTGNFKIGPAVTAPTVGTAWNSIMGYAGVTPTGLASSLNDYVLADTVGVKSGLVQMDIDGNAIILGSGLIVEGATDNAYETTVVFTDPTADRTITFPDSTGTVVLADSTNTLTNKTLTNPTISGLSLSDASIVFEGTVADSYETTLTVGEPTADRTVTIPDITGTLITTGDTGSISATMLASNSVTNAKLADDAVDTAEIKDSAVTSAKIANGTIINEDINSSAAIALSKLATDPLARANHTGTQTASTISDFNEAAQDAVGGILGTGLTYNDSSNTITVDTTNLQLRVTGVSDTEIGYLDGVTSAIQTQVDNKASLSGATFTGSVSGTSLTLSGDLTVNGTTTTLNSTTLSVDDKNIELGSVATPSDATADGGGITLKGSTDKTFNWVDATDAWTSSEHVNLASGKSLYLNGTLLKNATETLTNKTLTSPVINTPTGITKSDVGLGNVDNTTDAGKPISTATQTALDAKLASSTAASTYAPIASPTFTGTVAGITKTMVGLGNVDNTTDAGKPVSTATQTALDLKAALASPALTGTPTAPTATVGTNTTQVATTAYVRGEVAALVNSAGSTLDTLGEIATALGNDANLSTTLTTSIGLKAPIASPTFTGTVAGITKSMVGLGNVDNTSDASKPVSTATQTALDLKASLDSPTFTGTVVLPSGTITSSMILDGTVLDADINASAAIALSKLATDPLARANHTGSQAASTISDFNEAAQDAVGGILGSGLTYTDASNTITVDSSVIQLRVSGVTDTEIGYLDGVTSAIQTQLGTKAPSADPTFTGTVSGITKTMVGLSNVDNTTDALKPISTATQNALDLKSPLASPTFTGTPAAPTATAGTNSTQIATTAFVKKSVDDLINGAGAAYDTLKELSDLIIADESTASSLATTVGNKAPKADPTFTGTVTLPLSTGGYVTTNSSGVISSVATIPNLGLTNSKVTVGTTDISLGASATTIAGLVSVTSTGFTGALTGNASTVTNGVYTTDSGTVTNAMLAGSIANSKLSNSTISGVSLGSNLSALTIGTGLSGTSYNGSGAITIAIDSTVATLTGSQTLTNKTLTSPVIASISNTGTITVPSTTGTLALLSQVINNTLLSTTGDIIYASSANTPARLAAGTSGYLLTAQGAGVAPVWAAAPVSLPTQTGSSGKYLTTDGSAASWGTLVVPISTTTATAISANTATTVDTTALSAFTSIEYMVSLKQGSKIRTSKVLVQTDGASVDMTEFAITETGGAMTGVTVAASAVSTNAVLQVTVTDASGTNVTAKFSKVSL